MGITINGAIEYLTDFSIYSPYKEAIDKVSAYIEQMQADYENRLKADMVAILDKIRAEIVELQKDYHEYGWAYDDVLNIIDKYKESEGK